MICGSSTNFLFTTKKNNDSVVDVETPLMIMIQIQKTQYLRVSSTCTKKEMKVIAGRSVSNYLSQV